jgi:hypothetical protein
VALDGPTGIVVAMTTVLAHHLNGALALAFAAPPILVVAAVVLWLRKHGPSDEDEDFDWDDELERDAGGPGGVAPPGGPAPHRG